MFETFSYDIPSVLPPETRGSWAFMETNSASAVMQAVCPNEWSDIVSVLSTYRLDPNTWFKNRVVLDVESNAKDGNLDRDIASYRSLFEAGVISAGVIITKDRVPLLNLAKRLWSDYQATLPEEVRSSRLPIDLATSTVTAFDKAQLRVRRGVMGSCPILIVAANEKTWNGREFDR